MKRIFNQITQLARNKCEVFLLIGADRAASRVLGLCDRFARNHRDGVHVAIVEARPVLTTGGSNWMGSLNLLYLELLKMCPDLQAGMLWDDDMLLSEGLLRQLRGAFEWLQYDRIEAETVFLWDKPRVYNAGFPRHMSTILFRIYPGDVFPVKYVTHSPDMVARSANHTVSPHFILNYGYFDPAQRPLIWQSKRAAGLIDAHTLTLTKPPALRDLDAEKA